MKKETAHRLTGNENNNTCFLAAKWRHLAPQKNGAEGEAISG